MKGRLTLGIVIVAVALLPLLLDPRGYWIRVLTITLLFAAMAQAWNIVGGLANQTSLGHAAFFGIGAYTSTVLLLKFGISPWLGMLAGGALGGVAALVIAIPTMRLQGHYFALATLAFGEVMRVIANVWTSLTGGPGGLSVPFVPPGFAAYSFKLLRPHAYIALVALVVVTAIFEVIRRGAMGYRLRAIKQNPAAAEVIGVDTTRVKLQAAVISGALIAMLGTLYAQVAVFFDPDTVFGIASISIRIALIAIIGGVGTAAGPILGAFFIIPLEEIMNDLLSSRAAGLSQLVFGIILIAVILWRPRGFITVLDSLRARLSRSGGAMTILDVRAVSRRFGGLQALSEVTFSVSKGEIVGVIGPNGAGKTTLFSTLVGLIRPDAGTVTLDGKDLAGLEAPHGRRSRDDKNLPERRLVCRKLGAG